MASARKLSLRKERLTELGTDDLNQVVGGTHYCLTIPVNLCLSLQVCNITHELICLVPTLPNTCAC